MRSTIWIQAAAIAFAITVTPSSWADSQTAEQRLAALRKTEDAASRSNLPTRQMGKRIADHYHRLFTDQANAGQSAVELQARFDAIQTWAFYTNDSDAVRKLRQTFNLLLTKDQGRRSNFKHMYAAYLSAEMLDEARAFLVRFPNKTIEPLPELRSESSGKNWTEWRVSQQTRTLVSQDADLPPGPFVIILGSPLCHFSVNAANDIAGNPDLMRKMESHSKWIARIDGNFSFSLFKQWNAEHPRQQFTLAHALQERESLDSWDTPTFYFFHDGKLISKFNGWPKSGNWDQLHRALNGIGLE